MKLKAIKKGILALPDKEIKPLVEWLGNYYDGPVWNREMDADVYRLGADEWERRLGGCPEKSSPASPLAVAAWRKQVRQEGERMEQTTRRRQAAIRLINRIPFPTKAARTRMLKGLGMRAGRVTRCNQRAPNPEAILEELKPEPLPCANYPSTTSRRSPR